MKALVCGAGIAGLSAAGFLARSGWQVTVLEQAPAPRPEGYLIDFFGPGWAAADSLGALERIREAGYAIPRVDYVGRTGRRRASLRSAGFSRLAGGALASILRPDLEQALRGCLPDSVDLRYGIQVTAVQQDDDGVQVAAGRAGSFAADLLVGADGVHSAVRGLVFGPEQDYFRFLGYHVGAYLFEDAQVAAELGNRVAVTDTRDEAMFFYRLRDGRTTAMAVHRTDSPALPADPRAELRRRYGRLGWICPAALAHCPDRFYYDQVAQIQMPGWHAGRTVLLGDAAAAVSLLAGQGASLAVAGAQVLAGELAAQPDPATGLQSFEDRWRPQVLRHQAAGRAAAKWFVPATPLASAVRRTLVRLSGLPAVARLIGRTVAGQ
ncbi:FAD-dependent oxidoreductase [Arthrobacter mobilis]|uniref:NAD(P)-binding protein n=1 Tax=Arthrobacter mobilis TaxID=2724944 RepID=A0A7X6HDP1_9MICC|nr:FAD-dependent oxidoreductase [Arthrobacter mobilis]NKX55242.1 NAD(P)-binding protein [Arthrobacter mobilis]